MHKLQAKGRGQFHAFSFFAEKIGYKDV